MNFLLSNSLWTFLSLVTCLISLFSGFFIYFKNPHKRLHKVFFFFTFAFTFWALSEFFYRFLEDKESAYFWVKINYIFWPATIYLFAELAMTYTKDTLDRLIPKGFLKFLLYYLPVILIPIVSVWPSNPINLTIVKLPWGYSYGPTDTFLHNAFLLWGTISGFYVMFLYITYYFKAKNIRKKKQALTASLSYFVPVLLGTLSEYALPLLGYKIPEMTTLGIAIATIIVGYAIWKLDLYSINTLSTANKILSTMTESLILLSLDFKIEFINKSTSKLLNFPKEELIGESFQKIFKKNLNNLLNNKQISTREYLINKKNELIPVEISNTSIQDSSNKTFGILLLAKDITDRIETEKEKELMQKQIIHNSKLASIGTLASGVAHEVNNPLQIIQGNFEFYDEFMPEEAKKDPKAQTAKKCIFESVNRIKSIVDGLRTYGKTDSSDTNDINCHEAILKTVQLIKEIYSKEGINIHQNLNANYFKIKGGLSKLQQVLMNLLSNARDSLNTSSTDNQTITIITKNTNNNIEIILKDNGDGIDTAKIDKIFDPFYTTKDPDKGTGLGLSITHSLIKKMNGTIHANSQSGIETEFIITFPFIN